MLVLPARTWKRVRHDDPTGLLEAAEESTAAAVAWLEARGLPYEVADSTIPKGLDVVEFFGRVPDALRLLAGL